MSDNPYTGLHGSDNRAAAKGWDEGFAAADERIARLLRESDVMEGEWLERTAQLVEALELIRAHARLDLSQRGIAEAERYAVIADAALAAADREAPDELGEDEEYGECGVRNPGWRPAPPVPDDQEETT